MSSTIPNGLRSVRIERPGGEVEIEDATRLVVYFGPHHLLDIQVDDGRTQIVLLSTHHGVRLDASDVPSQLEGALEIIRSEWPGTIVD